MTKKTSDVKFRTVTNLQNEPDVMWVYEASKLAPWLGGKGADIGCGLRSVRQDSIRVDIDPNVKPDKLCSGDKLPFKDGELDYVSSVHSFEHFEDQHKVLKEWLRVVKVGGVVAIVHPDIQFTKKQNPETDNPGLKKNPYNKHYYENTLKSLISELKKWKDLPFRMIDRGVACENWSFFVILEKVTN